MPTKIQRFYSNRRCKNSWGRCWWHGLIDEMLALDEVSCHWIHGRFVSVIDGTLIEWIREYYSETHL